MSILSLFSTFISLLSLILNLIDQSFPTTVENGTFCYDEESDICGPKSKEWPGICQTGKSQSPIDLVHDRKTIKNGTSPYLARALNFRGYRVSQYFIRNNGHSIQVSFTPELTSSSRMKGYGMEGEYIFAQVHFHWGRNIQVGGSEHTLNGRHVPMEVHFVHYHEKYENFNAAFASLDDSKALAVLAVFLFPQDGGDAEPNPAFEEISSHLSPSYQPIPGQLIANLLDLNDFLPLGGDLLYRYKGSLTTPGCTESVLWTLDPEPIPVRLSDYIKFHQIQDDDNKTLSQNFRSVQPLFGREIQIFHKASSPRLMASQFGQLMLFLPLMTSFQTCK